MLKTQNNNQLVQKIAGIIVALSITALVIDRGGYYPLVTYICAAVVIVAFIAFSIITKKFQLSLGAIILSFMSIFYLISSLINGLTLTSLIYVCIMFCLVAFALLISVLDEDAKVFTVKILTIIGIISAVFGIILMTGLIPIKEFFEGNRLAFTFEYSNAAGIWFAIVAAMCWMTENFKFRLASLLPLIALLLTQSMGAILVTLVVAIYFAVVWFKDEEHSKQMNILAIIALCLCVIAGIVLCVVLNERIAQASQTFIERIIQVLDSFGLLLTHPFGIGANMWQYTYPYIQTAQYTAANVHCSYAQILLDGGIIAFLLFVVYCVYSLVLAWKSKNIFCFVCASMILLHSLVDFDLNFTAIFVLLILFLEPIEFSAPKFKISGKAIKCINYAMSVVVLIACVLGIFFYTQQLDSENIYDRVEQGEVPKSISELPPYMSRDPYIKNLYISALSVSDKKEEAAYYDEQISAANQALFKGLALAKCDKKSEAVRVVTDELMRQPYNLQFYKDAANFINSIGVSLSRKAQYNKAAKYANSLIHEGRAAWLNNQKEIELL